MKNTFLLFTILFVCFNRTNAQNYFRMKVTKVEVYCVKCWDNWEPNRWYQSGPSSDPAVDLIGRLSIKYNNQSIVLFNSARQNEFSLKTHEWKKDFPAPKTIINIDANAPLGNILLEGELIEIDDKKSSANDIKFQAANRSLPIKINDILLFGGFPNAIAFTFFDSKSESKISLILEIKFENNNDIILTKMEKCLSDFLVSTRHDKKRHVLIKEYWDLQEKYFEKIQEIHQKIRYEKLKSKYTNAFKQHFTPDIIQNTGSIKIVRYFPDRAPTMEAINFEPTAELVTFQKNGENKIGRMEVDEGKMNAYRLVLSFELLPFKKSYLKELEKIYGCLLDLDLIFPLKDFAQPEVAIKGILGVIEKSGRQIRINLRFSETNLAEQYLNFFKSFNENTFSLTISNKDLHFRTNIDEETYLKMLASQLSIEKNFEQEINSIQSFSYFPIRSYYKAYNKENKPLDYLEVFITCTNENLSSETIGPFRLSSQNLQWNEYQISLYCKNERTTIKAFGLAYYDYGHKIEKIPEVKISGCGNKSIDLIPPD